MKFKNTTKLMIAIVLSMVTASSVQAATVSTTYDIGANVGPSGTLLSSDGWAGGDIGNWQVASFGDLYARNTNDGDNLISRNNDATFSYEIPSTAVKVSIESVVRVNSNFWEIGLSDGANRVLGFGADFGGDNKYYILDAFARTKEAGASVIGDALQTLRLDYDLIAGTADLSLNNTILISNAVISNASLGALNNADGLFIRTNSRFVGPADFVVTVTSIPEPTTLGLLAIGSMMMSTMRRRRVS